MARYAEQVLISIILIVYNVKSQGFLGTGTESSNCQPLQAPICNFLRAQGYNLTQFPNIHGHRTQEIAIQDLNGFLPLIKTKCAEELLLFVCSTYLPLCIPNSEEILRPCRSLCLNSEAGCKNLMLRFGFIWPFRCMSYPDGEKGEMCFGMAKNATLAPEKTSIKKKKKGRKMRGKVSGREGETLKMKCPKGRVVEIRKVTHRNSLCCTAASKIVLSAICHKKTTCSFAVNQSTFGGHCQNLVGEVSIKYKCKFASKAGAIC